MPGKDISLTVCQTHQATNGHPRPPPGTHITLKYQSNPVGVSEHEPCYWFICVN